MEAALYLIPVTLGASPFGNVFPPANHDIILGIKHFIVEEERTARRFLKAVDSAINIDELTFYPMGKHADAALFRNYLKALEGGLPMGVISEAGCPAVADPGSNLVALAQAQGFQVCPLVGPSSILLALMGSGLSGQNFAFHGYLPIKDELRAQKISALEKDSRLEKRTQIFIETPYRNRQMLAALMKHCAPTSRICTASDLTLASETIISASVLDWRQREKRQQLPELDRRPTVFLLQA